MNEITQVRHSGTPEAPFTTAWRVANRKDACGLIVRDLELRGLALEPEGWLATGYATPAAGSYSFVPVPQPQPVPKPPPPPTNFELPARKDAPSRPN